MYEVEDESIQLVLTGPPYFHPEKLPRRHSHAPAKTMAEYIVYVQPVLSECFSKLREDGYLAIVRTDVRFRRGIIPVSHHIAQLCLDLGFHFVRHFIWKRMRGVSLYAPQFSNILVFSKRPCPSTRTPICPDVWEIPYRAPREHTGAMSGEVCGRLIEYYTSVGDTILDPFVGRGTVLVAALTRNRNGIGYEILDHYRPIIAANLERANQDGNADICIEVGSQ